MSGAEFRERRWSREDRTGPDRGPCPARRREIQDHAQDRPGRRAVSNTHSRRRAERACRGSNLIGRRASMGASIDAQCGAEACRVACDRKGDSDWRQINVTKRALPSPFKSEVRVLPGPPYNKINGLPGPLATLAAAIGDSREQRKAWTIADEVHCFPITAVWRQCVKASTSASIGLMALRGTTVGPLGHALSMRVHGNCRSNVRYGRSVRRLLTGGDLGGLDAIAQRSTFATRDPVLLERFPDTCPGDQEPT